LGRWLAKALHEHVLKHKHVLQPTEQLLELINTHTIPVNSIFVKLDVKDFFMTGEVHELTTPIREFIGGKLGALAADVAEFLLESQFLESPYWLEQCFKVILGSGMGLPHSGDVADTAFLWYVEIPFILSARNRKLYGIILYARYRDDMLAILNHAPAQGITPVNDFVSIVQRRAKPFRVSVESISHQEVCFLDVCLFKGKRWPITGKLDFKPYRKPTNIATPLNLTSSHPLKVHVSWVKAEAARLGKRASSAYLAEQAVVQFQNRLRLAGRPDSLVHGIYLHRTLNHMFFRTTFLNRAARDNDNGSIPVQWMVLPFHRVWACGFIKTAVNRFSSNEGYAKLYEQIFGHKPCIRLSWKLTSVPLAGLVAAD